MGAEELGAWVMGGGMSPVPNGTVPPMSPRGAAENLSVACGRKGRQCGNRKQSGQGLQVCGSIACHGSVPP